MKMVEIYFDGQCPLHGWEVAWMRLLISPVVSAVASKRYRLFSHYRSRLNPCRTGQCVEAR